MNARRASVLRRIGCALVLGVLTTIAIAWLLALLAPALVNRDGAVGKTLTNGRDSELLVTRFSSWGGFGFACMTATTVQRHSSTTPAEDPPEMPVLVPRWAFNAVVASFDDLGSAANSAQGWWCVEARGFPFAALWSAFDSPMGRGQATVHGGFLAPATLRREIPGALSAAVVLPVRPVWTGVIADSGIYAALWWTLLHVPCALRYFRQRRNHCPNCNYNFSGLVLGSPCPECGTLRVAANNLPP